MNFRRFYKKSRLPSLLKLNCQQQFQPATLSSFSPKTSSHGSHEEDHEGYPFLPPQDCKGGHEEDNKGQKKHGHSHRWERSPDTRCSREYESPPRRFTVPPSGCVPLPRRFTAFPGRYATSRKFAPILRTFIPLPGRIVPLSIGQ